ncbi:MAG: dockerin type I domain-containing protein [Planctomycetota bacterium]|nr:dockerin type I domain-containing protein [Planctomycetota bacterium]
MSLRRPFLVVLFVLSATVLVPGEDPFDRIRRGDANNDGTVDFGDAIHIANFLFNGGPAPLCEDAADANDDGAVDVADTSYLANWLFLGGPAPPAPGPVSCGADPTADKLTCGYSVCSP